MSTGRAKKSQPLNYHLRKWLVKDYLGVARCNDGALGGRWRTRVGGYAIIGPGKWKITPRNERTPIPASELKAGLRQA